jgi:hypothetical protein
MEDLESPFSTQISTQMLKLLAFPKPVISAVTARAVRALVMVGFIAIFLPILGDMGAIQHQPK